MVEHELRRAEGILILRPKGRLEAADFQSLAQEVDPYIEANGQLHGIMLGRPTDLPFSGASGRFQVSATAQPTELEAETPLRLTVRVQASGPVKHPPHRIDVGRCTGVRGRRKSGRSSIVDPEI